MPSGCGGCTYTAWRWIGFFFYLLDLNSQRTICMYLISFSGYVESFSNSRFKIQQSPRLIRSFTLEASIIGAFLYHARELNTFELRDRLTFYKPFGTTTNIGDGWCGGYKGDRQQSGLCVQWTLLTPTRPKTSTRFAILFVRAVFARARIFVCPARPFVDQYYFSYIKMFAATAVRYRGKA